MTVHWAAPWPKIDLQTRVKSDEILYHIFSNLSGMKMNWSYVPPHLVMPPGPGPTSTTWQPAREPPDLATRSSSLGSIMKFWESRFWAWKRNFFTINNPNVVKCLILPWYYKSLEYLWLLAEEGVSYSPWWCNISPVEVLLRSLTHPTGFLQHSLYSHWLR